MNIKLCVCVRACVFARLCAYHFNLKKNLVIDGKIMFVSSFSNDKKRGRGSNPNTFSNVPFSIGSCIPRYKRHTHSSKQIQNIFYTNRYLDCRVDKSDRTMYRMCRDMS